MSITENIVTGRKYRRITSTDPNVWERISFWTMAEDVELDDGTDLQTKLDEFETKAAGTANVAQVLNGYTFSSSYGVNLTGTMNNWGSNTVTMSSNTATLSAGYYSGISINAASRYTAGYNAHAMTRTLLYNCTYSYTSGGTTAPTATTSGSLNAAAYINDYANLTAANFALVTTRVTGLSLVRENATALSSATWYYVSANRSLSYNASNGKVTLNIANASYEVKGHNTVAGLYDSYLVYCYHA